MHFPIPSCDNDWLLCLIHQNIQRWREIHIKVKNNVRHVMSIIFLPNDKLNHRSSSGGVVGADEPLQWGRAQHNFQRFRCTIAGSDRSQKQIVDKSSAINKIWVISINRAMMEGIPEHTKTWQSICVRKAIYDIKKHNCVPYLLISWQISRCVGDCSRVMLGCCPMSQIVLPPLFHHVMVALVTTFYLIHTSFCSKLFTVHRY